MAIFVTLILFLASISSHADSQLFSSTLIEMDGLGHELSGHELKLTAFGRNGVPTRFHLEKKCESPCEGFGETAFIVEKNSHRCGAQVNFARSSERDFLSARIIDHRTDYCDDWTQKPLELFLREGRKSTRYLGVILKETALSCEEYENVFCTMNYDPARCEAKATLSGVLLPNKLEATSGNSCGAESTIKLMACQQGTEPEGLDISCERLTQ